MSQVRHRLIVILSSQINIPEIPSTPNNLTVHYLVQSTNSRVISVKWSAPENLERFDLEYYIVQVLVSEQGRSYIRNGTTAELEYIFNLDSVPLTSSIQIMVTAVSKCGTHSPILKTRAPLPEMVDFSGEQQAHSKAINGNNY